MSGLAFSSMRVGNRYCLVNHGEKTEFILEEVLSRGDYQLKDLYSLERYRMSDLIRYGRGEDFELSEMY